MCVFPCIATLRAHVLEMLYSASANQSLSVSCDWFGLSEKIHLSDGRGGGCRLCCILLLCVCMYVCYDLIVLIQINFFYWLNFVIYDFPSFQHFNVFDQMYLYLGF